MNSPSPSHGWLRWALIAALAMLLSLSMSAKFFSGARARGWLGGVEFRQATVQSVVVSSLSSNHRQIFAEWTLEAAPGAHGTATLEVDYDQPFPRQIPVAFDRETSRWYARDDLGTDRGNILLDLSFAVLALVVACGSTVMALVRRAASNTPASATIDRDALASIAREEQRSRAFLAFRACAALAFYLGLHLVSLAILALAAGVLWLMVEAGRFNLALVAACCVAVFAVGRVYLSFSQAERSEIAGPRLRRDQHPALFAELDALAARCNTTAPDEVVLEDSHNAAVIEDSRWLGFFPGKRTLILGLSLLRTTSVSELRAVIAHELGHFVGSDTRFGAILYAIRSKAIALVHSIHETQKHVQSINVAKPYLWYLEVFLFVTHKLSRTQELLADKLSVAIAGREPHINELKKSAKSVVAADAFWRDRVVPIINAGMLPSDLDRQEAEFVAQPTDAESERAIEQMLLAAPTRPFDTHPSLAERIAFAEMLESPAVDRDDRLALSLVNEALAERAVADARHALIESRVGAKLESVTMEQAIARMNAIAPSPEAAGA
ncbi:MAG: M48 family metallopeptidase [Polyangiales bacterium]